MTRRKLVPALALAVASLAGCAGPPRAHHTRKVMLAESEPDKLMARGQAFAEMGDTTRAAQYFTRALEQGADEAKVLPLLMRVYVVSNRYRVAIERGRAYLVRHPDQHQLRYLIGTLLVAIDHEDAALEEFRIVASQAPKHALAHYNAAVLLRDTKSDWVRADFHFRRYLALEPDGEHSEEARANLLRSVP